MVQTADTGQINWATVLKPTAINTKQGYEVWRFNDALHATAPLFVKFEYGSGGTAVVPAVWVTLGKGSDGAGAITSGVLSATQVIWGTSGTSSTVVPWLVSSGDGSMLVFSAAPTLSTGSTRLNINIERSRAANGSHTAIGALLLATGTVSYRTHARNYADGTGISTVNHPAAVPLGLSTAVGLLPAGATEAALFPSVVSDGSGHHWQPRCMLAYAHPDIPAMGAIPVDGWGTYMPLGAAGGYADAATQEFARAAMAWW
jgi:hypothetical protein